MNLGWLRRPSVPSFVRAYRAGTPAMIPRRTSVDQLSFVVVDAETTGFDATKDRILSLGAVPVQGGTLTLPALRSWLVFQAAVPLTDAVRVHGILPAQTRTGEAEATVLEELLPILTGAVLVGHHLGFDLAMLNAALHRHYRCRLRNPRLDTAVFAMRVLEPFRRTGYPGQRAPSLDEVCTYCEIQALERHTAEGDAFTTAEVLMMLCARLSRKLGRQLTVADLPIERG